MFSAKLLVRDRRWNFSPLIFYGAVSFGVWEGGEVARLPDQPIPD